MAVLSLRCRSRCCLITTLLFLIALIRLAGISPHRIRVKYNYYIATDGPWRTNGGPPKYLALRNWEATLPQHNLSLPFPEGKSGRYVKFSNQIRMLGWNNCFNEL